MVSELYLREFRGIKDCQKPLKISKFTVLVGRNNTGKSAILEALSLLPHPYLPSMPILIRPIAEKISKYHLLCQLHSEESLVYGYAGEFYIRCLLDVGKWEFVRVDRESVVTINGQNLYLDTQYARLSEIFGMSKNELEKLVVFIPSDTRIIKEIDKTLDQYKNLIMKLGAHVRVAKAISECVSDRFTEVYLDTMKIRKELPDGNVFYISLDDLGDGIKKAVRVMLLIEALKPKLILWDDFEVFAHPSLINLLLKWLIEGDWQVVISTHSIDVLYELVDLGRKKDVTVLLLEKDESDVLLYEKLTIDELEDLIVANQDPRRLASMLSLR